MEMRSAGRARTSARRARGGRTWGEARPRRELQALRGEGKSGHGGPSRDVRRAASGIPASLGRLHTFVREPLVARKNLRPQFGVAREWNRMLMARSPRAPSIAHDRSAAASHLVRCGPIAALDRSRLLPARREGWLLFAAMMWAHRGWPRRVCCAPSSALCLAVAAWRRSHRWLNGARADGLLKSHGDLSLDI